jgi:signal transduction histidine kinase
MTHHNFEIERVFERFYTSDLARTHSTGQGLYIVKSISEKMGFEVTSALVDGSMVIEIIY